MKLFALLLTTFLMFNGFAETNSDTLSLGRGNATNKKIVAKRAAGNTNPDIRWNESNTRWEFSNDGANWSALGSGSGGSGGINLLTNGGFESGTTEWSASAGTFTTTTTAANVGNALAAGSWIPAASTNTLTSSQKTIYAGLYGRNCLAKVLYKKTANVADHTLRVLDGSSNVLATVALPQAATYQEAVASFVCPTSGTIAIQVYAGGTDQIFVDEAHLGENFLVGQISQASNWGKSTISGNSCTWAISQTSYAADFSADSDCTYATSGNLTEPATKIPGVKMDNLPPGTYDVTMQSTVVVNASADTACRLVDDLGNVLGYQANLCAISNNTYCGFNLKGQVTYTTAQSSRTIKAQCFSTSGTASLNYVAVEGATEFFVKRFPTSTDTALRADQTGWFVEGYIGGADPSLGTAAVATLTGIENGSLSLTNSSGAITAQIPCSSTNPSTGTTCAAGSESVGIVYTQPVAGPVEACVSFTEAIASGGGGSGNTSFQIVETTNTSQTISTTGAGSGVVSVPTASSSIRSPVRFCSTFNFASAGQKTLRLFYTQDANTLTSATIIATNGLANTRDRINWSVKPIGPLAANPVIVNSISSNGAGPWRHEAGKITCSGSSSVVSQTGTWISSIGNVSSGNCAITFSAGAFSSTPICTVAPYYNSENDLIITIATPTSSGLTTKCYDVSAAGQCSSYEANLICMGAR